MKHSNTICPPIRTVFFALGLTLICTSAQTTQYRKSEYQISGGADYNGELTATESANLARLKENADSREALDEALGGKTVRGTPVFERTPAYFPAENRDLFWQMDQVANGDGELVPINFDVNGDGKIDENERRAIQGRNTWLLWGGGNEAFWGWLQERGYGIEDFQILLDSRTRNTRFARGGLINQPGFESNPDPENPIAKRLGLYIDKAIPSQSSYPPLQDKNVPNIPPPLPGGIPGDRNLFLPGDKDLYQAIKEAMPRDGLDYSVYGYPSGIFGLRLTLNPDFFGSTADAAKARKYWDEKVVKSGKDYYDPKTGIQADPNLIRPFRPAMSCGFCHIGPHPLRPPLDVENPKWENLSSIIGSQYWKPQENFANTTDQLNFLNHFLKSQAPGTIDTSLVSTDHLNNTNVINAIFDVPARMELALNKPPEIQKGANLLFIGKQPTDKPVPLHCPLVLFPGEDSVGMLPALARVPLNIGVFSEQWERVDNPVIGFRPQRPFSVATCRTNSVYWMVNEQQRVPYMAAFFTLGGPEDRRNNPGLLSSTAPMKLEHALPGSTGDHSGKFHLENATISSDTEEHGKTTEKADPLKGRRVFLKNCAICHSSKQPEGFDLKFTAQMEGGWRTAPAPAAYAPAVYTLPTDYLDWEEFRQSPAFADYRSRIEEIAGASHSDGEDPFLQNNFLSNERRIPITLVATHPARALATNATAGNVWDNYSSDTYKNLKSVGKIRYYDIFSGVVPTDKFGTNAEFDVSKMPGGPGYMRPPSLISLWATAPYFHNNSLGLYNHNPDVDARIEAFEDGIDKLLNTAHRRTPGVSKFIVNGEETTYYAPGDLRPGDFKILAASDPGFIYRLPQDGIHYEFAPGFTPQLIKGVAGKFLFNVLAVWLWVLAFVLFLAVALRGRARHAGILVLLLAVFAGAVLATTGLGGFGGTMVGALMALSTHMLGLASGWLWLIPLGLAALGLWLSLTSRKLRIPIRNTFLGLALLTIVLGVYANRFLNGHSYGIRLGPIPPGVPVDLMMNLDPGKKDKLPPAIVGMARANLRIKREGLTGASAYRVFAKEAGPALLEASKCPDFVLDRGHWFGEELTTSQKKHLTAFLKTL